MTNKADTQELLPCPFCGADAAWGEGEQKEKYGNEQVYCTSCYATSAPEMTKDEAAAWWNSRAALVPSTSPPEDTIHLDAKARRVMCEALKFYSRAQDRESPVGGHAAACADYIRDTLEEITPLTSPVAAGEQEDSGLLPCAFCNSPARLIHAGITWSIHCVGFGTGKCWVTGPTFTGYVWHARQVDGDAVDCDCNKIDEYAKTQAIAAWNSRTPSVSPSEECLMADCVNPQEHFCFKHCVEVYGVPAELAARPDVWEQAILTIKTEIDRCAEFGVWPSFEDFKLALEAARDAQEGEGFV